MKVEQFLAWEKEMKVVERVGEQKKSWEKSLKDMAWSSYIPIGTQILATTYTMNLRWYFEYFLGLLLGMQYIFLKLKKSGIQCFKQYGDRRWNEEDIDNWRKLRKEESKECQFCMNLQNFHMIVWNGLESLFCSNLEISFTWTNEFSHEHATFRKCIKMMLECYQSIYILHDHEKRIILMQN